MNRSTRLELDRVAVVAGTRHARQLAEKFGGTVPEDMIAAYRRAFLDGTAQGYQHTDIADDAELALAHDVDVYDRAVICELKRLQAKPPRGGQSP